MKRPFFVFAHLTKCAGTTFINILRRNLGDRFRHDNGLLQDYQYTLEQMSRIIAMYPALDCIASHRYGFALPFANPACPREVHAFSFVRHPVDRALSHYFFHRGRPWVNTDPVHVDLLPYFEKFDREPASLRNYKDGQTRLLAGPAGLPRLEELVRAGHARVFPIDRFDDAMLVLETAHPDFFPDCSYVPLNTSARDQSVPGEVRQLILRHQQTDFELCRFAAAQLDAELQRLFPDPAALAAKRANFAQRKQLAADKAAAKRARAARQAAPPRPLWHWLKRRQ